MQIKELDGRRMLLAPDGQDLLAHQGDAGSPEPSPTIIRSIGLAYAALRAIEGGEHDTAELRGNSGSPTPHSSTCCR